MVGIQNCERLDTDVVNEMVRMVRMRSDKIKVDGKPIKPRLSSEPEENYDGLW